MSEAKRDEVVPGERWQFDQGVADAFEISLGDRWGDGQRSSRLVVVGFALDRAALSAAFSECAMVR